jgi:hypothetical protein
MKKINTLLSILLSIIVSATSVNAQSDCENSLYNSNLLYESGKIRDAINKLEPCLYSMSGKEQLFQSYRLLAIAYQDLDKLDYMNKYIKLMLSERPDYQKYPNNDPIKFTKAVSKFTVTPKLYAGVKVGASFNNIELEQSFSALNYPQVYNSTNGYQLGIMGDYRIKSDIGISANIMFSGTSIDHELNSPSNWRQSYTEQLRFYQISVGAKKYFPLYKDLRVFGGVELGVNMMNYSQVFIEFENLNNSTIELHTKDGLDERNKMQPYYGIQAGISYPLERGTIGLELGYNFYTNTTVDEGKRMEDQNFIFNTQYINDDIKMRLFTVNLIYTIPISYSIDN